MIPDLQIQVTRVGHIVVPLPRYQTAGASGMDLHAAIDRPLKVKSLERVRIPTGLILSVPAKFEAQVRPRSGLAFRDGITVLNAPGTVDSDYRGEIMVLLVNLGKVTVTINPLDRIAQLVVSTVARAELVEVTELDETKRGAGGYGSTGV
ncbi:MAG: dUTP diphosphatase [Polyangiaceae bacterium]